MERDERPYQGAFDEVDETKVRVAWRGVVRVLEDFGTIVLHGRELGRTTLIVEGPWLLETGRTITIEIELAGQRFQVLTHVLACVVIDDVALTMLRIGASSPQGNDLIAAQVRRRLPPTTPSSLAA